MGDGEETTFSIEDVLDSAVLAIAAVEEIVDSARETFPFLSDGCPRCRWRGSCLPALQEGPDLSFVAGVTRTRKRLLAARGIRTVGDLAALDGAAVTRLDAAGLPVDGLGALVGQARALVAGKPVATARRRPREIPGGGGLEHFMLAEWNPLDGEEPFLLGLASRPGPRAPRNAASVLLARSGAGAQTDLLEAALSRLGDGDAATSGPILHFGGSAPRAFGRFADRAGLDPQTQGRIEGRFFDLAPAIRAGAYLPVRRYRLEEVAAVLAGRTLPPIGDPEDAPFVWFENLRTGVPGSWQQLLESHAARAIEALATVRDHLAPPSGAPAPGPERSGRPSGPQRARRAP